MAHKADYFSELHVFDKNRYGVEIVLTTDAEWKNKSERILKEDYSGCQVSDHLSFSMMGWVVSFTGEKRNYYYGYQKASYPQLYNVDKRPNLYSIWINRAKFERDLIEADSKLKYFVNKTQSVGTAERWFDLFKVYRKHPEIESLCEMSLYNIALDKRLWRFSKDKLKQVINFIRQNNGKMRDNLSDVLFAMKHNVAAEYVQIYASNNYQYDITNKLSKWETDRYTYRHYLGYLTKLGKADDEYWTNPNTKEKFWINYQTAQEQYEAVIEAERIARELADKKAKSAAARKLRNGLKKLQKKYEAFTKIIGNYKLYVPYELRDIQNQAKVLNQCLISMNYHMHQAEGKSILVFIKDLEDHPIATAELSPKDYRVRQFYADEYDRDNCKPSEEVTNIFNEYREMVIPKSSNKMEEARC